MFKNPFQVAIVFALVALIIKLTIFYLGLQHSEFGSYITHIYMLILLVAVFFGIRSSKIAAEGPTSFGQDFKAGARSAAFFAILVGGITFFYYSKIDVEFFPTKKAEMISQYSEKIQDLIDEKGFEEARSFLKNNIIGLDTIYSPLSQANYTLFGLVFMGMFNSLIFAFLMKKMPGFRQ